MARMIPDTIGTEAAPGEIAVFEAIAASPGAASWHVLHGLPIAHHTSQSEGEADFVIAIPHVGIIVIEIKSHLSVSYREGLWQLGRDEPTRRGPVQQAADNMYSLRDFLAQRSDWPQIVPMWRAVWFPGIPNDQLDALRDRIDVERREILGQEDLCPDRLPGAIQQILTKHSAFSWRQQTYFDVFTPTAARQVCDLLLPAFRTRASAFPSASEREKSIEEATEQQSHIVRMLGEAPRVIVDGGAGSGKTHVATRAALRAANRDQRVLLTMFNIYLEEHLQHVLRDSDVTVRRIHAEMMRISGLEPPAHADNSWWGETLPKATLGAMQREGFEAPYDLLVIDEAQDLVPQLTLDVLDGLVVGGLDGGQVWALGDFKRQGIHHRESRLREAFAERMPGAAPVLLDRNVRATPALVEFIESLIESEFSAEVLRADAPSEAAQVVKVAEEHEADAVLPAVVQLLLEEGWTDDEILILSPRRIGAAQRCANSQLAERLSDTNEAGSGIRAGTIHKFKGLEAPAVVLTDVSTATDADRDLLYVGATRATDRLIVVMAADE